MNAPVRIILAFLCALALEIVFVPMLLPFLRKLKAGQTEREDGPQSHLEKNGTPTMGGISFIAAILIAALIFGGFSPDALMMLAGMLLFGFVGFTDDYIKVVKKRNLGLTPWQKIAMQVVFSFLIALYASKSGTQIMIPFLLKPVDFGWLYIPFEMFVMLAMSNSVNLTDGVDGLCSSVTAVVAFTFAIVGYRFSDMRLSVFEACIVGGCLGFLAYNKHPAKLFMGDTGSMALGGALAAGAIISGNELILPIAGGIYVAEAMSVIIQVFVFKTQHGRRFFRMAPLHHHYELGGWSEVKVVRRFSLVTGGLCLIAFLGVLI